MADNTLREILDLAARTEKSWLPKMAALRASGVPLNLDDEKPLFDQLRERREQLATTLETALTARDAERSEFDQRVATFAGLETPTDEQRSGHLEARSAFASAEAAFNEAHAARLAEIQAVQQRIDTQELQERRRVDAAAASRHDDVSVNSEPLTYRSDNSRQYSYYLDLACQQVPAVASRLDDPTGRQERLQRHAAEMNVELPKREAKREARARAQTEAAEREFRGSFVEGVRAGGLEANPFEKRVNPNRTDGQGGYFVPPLWLIDEYLPALRAGRVAAGLCRNLDLPAGTDNIKLPAVATGTTVAMQTADGAGVSSTDMTDAVVECSVQTAAGQQDVAIQVIEQSPGQIFDDVITGDLYADYNRLVDRQVVMGTGANGQVKGILPVSNWTGANTVTWTTSTILGSAYNQAMGAAASKVSYNRYSLENLHFLGHPRRWFWFATALDGASGTSGRAMVSADGFGPHNANGLHAAGGTPSEGLAGRMPFGPNYYIDGNVPIVATAAGAVTGGTNDLSIAAKWDDLWLFEGALRTRVLSEVLSGTLQIRFQLYSYIAFLTRYGQSIAVTLGTGMAAPASLIDSSITY